MNEQLWRLLEAECIDGKYYLKELLGVGGYGAVFRADEVVGDRLIRQVAVKLISPEGDQKNREKQLEELIAAVKLDHPHLIRCYAPGLTQIKIGEMLYLVMELGAETLAKLLEQKPGALGEEEVEKIVKEIGAALVYLHQEPEGQVHRDVKPANVIKVGEYWKLADFGLMRSINSGKSARTSSRKGTSEYAPPEAYEGVVATGWDIWSLGVIMAEMLTGKLPFIGETEQQLMVKVIQEEPSIEWSKISQRYREIIQGALEKDREKRWTATMVLNAMTKTPAPISSHPKPISLTPPPSPQVNFAPSPQENLVTSRADLRKLDQLLSDKKWQEADQETTQVMLKVMTREKEGYLTEDNCRNFPKNELRMIDQLWLKYSNDKFGFSVQKKIWLKLGGKLDSYDSNTYVKLGDEVGWRKGGSWLNYSDLTFNISARRGHLPLFGWVVVGCWWVGLGDGSLLSSLDSNMVPTPAPSPQVGDVKIPHSTSSPPKPTSPTPAPSPQVNFAPSPQENLVTSRADLRKLDQLLSDKKWQEADQETNRVMCKIMNREKEGWLTADNCRNFPKNELRMIDQLWLKYSNDKFGFSVQKKIWLKLGGKLDSYDSDTYVKLGDEVGWRKGGNWLNYSDLTFNIYAPLGHLPGGGGGGFLVGELNGHCLLFSSLDSNMVPTPAPSPQVGDVKIPHSTSSSPKPTSPTPAPSPQVNFAPSPQENLVTSRADLRKLDQLLSDKKWQEADQETARVMCKIMNREKERWLTPDDCRNFPKNELRMIDQLWLKYSNDKFGFSVQKKIWLKLGGKLDYDYDTYVKIGDEVGWRKGGNWLSSYSNFTFNISAPAGHLPAGGVFGLGVWVGWGFGLSLFSSLDSNMVPTPALSPQVGDVKIPHSTSSPPKPTSPTPAPSPQENLVTSRADLRKLDQLLLDKKWQEADQETVRVMCKIMNREKEGWLTADNCRNFPKNELRMIDQLWLKYSNDKFGFSVQKKIWLKLGGKLDSYDSDTYVKLGDEVGWRKGGNWLSSYSNFTFNISAPMGHLPVWEGRAVGGVLWVWGGVWGISFLFSRL